MRFSIVIPVLNQLQYTQLCVDSLIAHDTPVESLLVIDNGSTDETPAWLASRPDIRSIRNAVNLGIVLNPKLAPFARLAGDQAGAANA